MVFVHILSANQSQQNAQAAVRMAANFLNVHFLSANQSCQLCPNYGAQAAVSVAVGTVSVHVLNANMSGIDSIDWQSNKMQKIQSKDKLNNQ